ncbi:MAG: M13 family metallopeptidase [Bacteroidota bacterium]
MARYTAILTIGILLILAINISLCQTKQTKPLDPANMDQNVKPTDDFYQFANGGWVKNNPIPPDQSSWGGFNELRDKNLYALRDILENAAKNPDAPKGSNLQKVGDFYYSGMDSVAIEAQGSKPLDDEMNSITSMKNMMDLQKEIAHLQTMGLSVPFAFGSGQDFKKSTDVIVQFFQAGIGLPDRDYYTRTDDESKKLRDQYTEHVAKMFILLGDDDAIAKKEAATVMDFETQIANASMKNVDMRDPDKIYHKMTISELNDLTPDYLWSAFFTSVGLGKPGAINVGQPDFMKQVNTMLTSRTIDDWKVYLRWHLVNATASFLSSPFVKEDFHFKGTILNGQKEMKPRWKRIVQATDNSVGAPLGQLYVAKYFTQDAKARAAAMINNLKTALHDKIQNLTWMSEDTKKQAIKKLDAFGVKVGYPDKWRDYSGLEIDRGPYALNMLRVGAFDFKYDLDKIGKPVDRTEWGMTPPTVNAYYSPTMNEIVFPAGIMQPPFFDPNADDAVNYGGMGAVIGHEMSHGFDDSGCRFDGDGNLKNWWTIDDSIKYAASTSIIEKQFNNYVAIDTLHVNGKLTLGENIGDFGGLTIAYAAFKKATEGKPQEKIDGFTPDQRFFLAWAQIWRVNYRPQSLKLQVNTNPHSPGMFRTNGPLSDMPEFYSAFDAKDGDKMMRPADQRPKIW